MFTSLQKCSLVEEAVSFFTNKQITKMKTYPTDDWNTRVYDTILIEGEKPPKEEFEAKLQELIDARPWKKLREERDKRLAKCDWVATKAFTTNTPVPEEWKTYMQALRDLPANTTDPENPVWPTPPP